MTFFISHVNAGRPLQRINRIVLIAVFAFLYYILLVKGLNG